MRRSALVAAALIGNALVACVAPQNAEVFERGMVVCEHPLAAQVGRDVLERGGNAVDAAVATALALAVVYPQAGNLGGGGFALVVPVNGPARVLDFRETAPASADPALLFDADGVAQTEWMLSSPHAVGVPGSPAGLFELLQVCGSHEFTLAELCAPAIELAQSGFAVDAQLARDLRVATDRARLERSPAARERFYPRGEALHEGDVLVQTDLAATLRRFATRGPSGFYSGEVAERLMRELERAGLELPKSARPENGWMRASDLTGYAPKWREPLRGEFRGREVFTMPPPSSGGIILLQSLAVLEPLARETFDATFAHALVESLRGSFAERAEVMGDPDFAAVPVERLLSKSWSDATRSNIGERASTERNLTTPREGTNTTHLSVVDSRGNAVSLTTTLNSTFGSGMLVEGAGFLLNNELDDFALGTSSLGFGARNQFGLVGSAANSMEPHKRPLSSMTPTIVRREGRVELVLGSPGGPRIITSVVIVLLRAIAFGEPLAGAVAAPRLHQQWSPSWTRVEQELPAEWIDSLRARGHEVDVRAGSIGGVQAIGIDAEGRVDGVSDPRRGGAALGTRSQNRRVPGGNL